MTCSFKKKYGIILYLSICFAVPNAFSQQIMKEKCAVLVFVSFSKINNLISHMYLYNTLDILLFYFIMQSCALLPWLL